MKSKTSFIAGLCLTLFCVLATPGILMADDYNQATKMTFNEPVEIPGQVLPAGTYWFELTNSESNRNIVQVWNADRTQLVATVQTIADYRFTPTGKPVVNFEERPRDQPEAIQAWFYPGENYGHEFVYPKTRATALAQQIHQPVISMPDEASTDTVPPVKAVTQSGEQIEVSEVIASEPKTNVEEASLPQTASLLPLWAMLGFAAIGASFGFRRLARSID